jgi:hypothetical protein
MGFCAYQLPLFAVGWVAQLVEQRTENPCVAGSIPASATTSFHAHRSAKQLCVAASLREDFRHA